MVQPLNFLGYVTAVIFQNTLLKAQSIPKVNPLHISQLLVGTNGIWKENSRIIIATFMNIFLFVVIPWFSLRQKGAFLSCFLAAFWTVFLDLCVESEQ